MACGGMIFIKKFQILEKKKSFYFISFNFFMYYCCSINLKKHSEHSGLRPDTSSLVLFDGYLQSIRLMVRSPTGFGIL